MQRNAFLNDWVSSFRMAARKSRSDMGDFHNYPIKRKSRPKGLKHNYPEKRKSRVTSKVKVYVPSLKAFIFLKGFYKNTESAIQDMVILLDSGESIDSVLKVYRATTRYVTRVKEALDEEIQIYKQNKKKK